MASPLPFVASGSGVPLLLVHGFPHDKSLWSPQMRTLYHHAHVIAPDLRGFGGASSPPTVMTMEQHAADLVALLDHLGVERAVVCGLSMGGYVAQALLAEHPDRLLGLVLCNTKATADDPAARDGREATAVRALNEGVAGIAEGMITKMVAPGTAPEVVQEVLEMMARQRPEGVAASARGMALRHDRLELLSASTLPITIITGDADVLIPMSESAAMHRAATGSTLVTIPGVGHLSNREAPEAFDRAVLELLARIDRPS